MKVWKSTANGDDRIIAYKNNVIYKGNPRNEEIDKIILELGSDHTQTKLFGVPQALLKSVNYEEGTKFIEVLFGADSSEHLKITNDSRLQEIFGYFKDQIPNGKYSVEKYSKFKAGKKPLYAMLLVTGIFLWTFFIARAIENGSQYRIAGSLRSISTVILAVASLGVYKVILIFGSLFGIALLSFVLKTKKPKVVHTIEVIR